MVSLTFDDGPDPTWTPRVLEELAQAEVSATFFVVAEQIAEPAGADLVRAILAAGHRVEAHCSRHLPHDERDEAAIRADVGELLRALETGFALRPRLWRPPYGRLNHPHSFAVADQVNLQLVLWTCDPRDYRNRTWSAMLEDIEPALYPDSVILLHDSRRYAHDAESAANTAALIQPLADLARHRGLELGPLAEPLFARARRAGEDSDLVPASSGTQASVWSLRDGSE